MTFHIISSSPRTTTYLTAEINTDTILTWRPVLGAELVAPGRTGRDLLLDSIRPGSLGSSPPNVPPELTCISEEGGLDLDLDLDIPEHLLEDLDCGGDCITSCNKVCGILLHTGIYTVKWTKLGPALGSRNTG